MALKKKDFIEIEFTGKIKNGEIFDSNIKEDLEKTNLNVTPKPFVFCLGEGMFIKGVDDFLIGKEIGKYNIELSPENAFGKRESRLVQIMPTKVFNEQKINPFPGAMFNFDGRIAKVLTVSGGRVIVDFNNPLAGKEVIYNLNVLRKIEEVNKKIKALTEFLFKKDFNFKLEEKKIVMEVEKEMAKFVELFKDKYQEIFNLELEVKEIEKSKEETEKEIN
ncbi:MAG: peptidylprolyl isomerase [Nanoarchaeota archaeon]|nr:peptidylprolyl isomerase [Nanoarchaeota archaeon]